MIVGDKALDALAATPKNVISETKRQMENDVVYSVEKGEWIEKEDADDNNSYTPAQVSSFILNKLKVMLQMFICNSTSVVCRKSESCNLRCSKNGRHRSD